MCRKWRYQVGILSNSRHGRRCTQQGTAKGKALEIVEKDGDENRNSIIILKHVLNRQEVGVLELSRRFNCHHE
jgi:hypothetical protein